MSRYRLDRIRAQLRTAGAAMGIFVSPVSLRYAVGYRGYALFQSHIPSSYLFVASDGPVIMHGIFGDPPPLVDEVRPARPIAYFHAGSKMASHAGLLAGDIVQFLSELGTDNRRVAIEYVNPTVTRAALDRGLDVIDAADLIEEARIIKSKDELDCMRWAIAVVSPRAAKGSGSMMGVMTTLSTPGRFESQ